MYIINDRKENDGADPYFYAEGCLYVTQETFHLEGNNAKIKKKSKELKKKGQSKTLKYYLD